MQKIDWHNPREVARWAAEKVYHAFESATNLGNTDQVFSQCLWVRTTLDGPGFMLTAPEQKPRGGLWTKIAVVDIEDATRIVQRGPRGWPALCRLVEKIEEVLPGAKDGL